MISFDILYKKKLENESIKLLGESQLRQMKLMICGKYKIYDFSHIFIYYRNKKITSNDNTKIKDIFKTKKAMIEVTDKEKNNINKDNDKQITNSKYTCICGASATYICDKCEEFLCNFCIKKINHIAHEKNIIKISDYSLNIKNYLKTLADELDNKILKNEAYKFLKYWEYDKNREIKTINNLYDFIKEQLEDIKQIEIDCIINLSEGNKYDELKIKLQNALNDYTSFNLNTEIEDIIEQKKVVEQNSQDILTFFNNIKIELLKYTRLIKELQLFNQEFQKNIQNNFNIIKKRYNENNNLNLNLSLSYNNFNTSMSNENINFDKDNAKKNKIIKNNSMKNLTKNLNNSALLISVKTKNNLNKKNKSSNKINNNLKDKTKTSVHFSPDTNTNNNKNKNVSIFQENNEEEKEFEKLSLSLLNTSSLNDNNNKKKKTNYDTVNSSSPMNNSKSRNKNLNLNTYSSNKNINNNILLKLKDKKKILIFNLKTQTFNVKVYYDKTNFRKELSSEADVIQLNLNNNLYMLSGKENNKFYLYNSNINSIIYINNTLYSHFYGVLLYCKKYNYIYLLGGNNQKNCEMFDLNRNLSEKKIKRNWKSLPSLNEERQEFGAMIYNDDYLYVFFGFSHIKGVNLNSIERMNIDTCQNFEIVYANEQIALSSIGCAFLNNDKNDDSENGILLLGGFDGEKYIEGTLVFSPEEMKIRECDIIIPNINKHFQFLFHKETNFIEVENNLQVVFDMKNNVHVLTNHSYELFTEVS